MKTLEWTPRVGKISKWRPKIAFMVPLKKWIYTKSTNKQKAINYSAVRGENDGTIKYSFATGLGCH